METYAADQIPLTISDPRQFFGGASDAKSIKVEGRPLLSSSQSNLSGVKSSANCGLDHACIPSGGRRCICKIECKETK
jgi:hypothetical protein